MPQKNKIDLSTVFKEYAPAGLTVLAITFGLLAGLRNPYMWTLDKSQATESVEKKAKLNPIKVGGYSYTGCEEKISWNTKFTATNAEGKEVSGILCQGLAGEPSFKFEN